jgi:hypothetical protein
LNYTFKTTPQFRRSYRKLTPVARKAVLEVFTRFRHDPFAPQLGTHPIATLSARAREPVYSVPVLPNLRAIFVRHGQVIVTLDVGTHDVYR